MNKKFRLTWDERITDHDDEFLHMEEKCQIIEAENADAACKLWEEENKNNEYQNGLDDCVEIVEHPLFAKRLIVDMPDGCTYGVPIEVIARNRAEYYAGKEFNDDVTKSLTEDTLPLFEADEFSVRDWASNNMNWSDVNHTAVLIKKNASKDDFQDAWVNGKHRIA